MQSFKEALINWDMKRHFLNTSYIQISNGTDTPQKQITKQLHLSFCWLRIYSIKIHASLIESFSLLISLKRMLWCQFIWQGKASINEGKSLADRSVIYWLQLFKALHLLKRTAHNNARNTHFLFCFMQLNRKDPIFPHRKKPPNLKFRVSNFPI